MTEHWYIERQSQTLIDEIDDILFTQNEYDPLLNRARWEITRLREIVYEQTIELGIRQWEINQLNHDFKD